MIIDCIADLHGFRPEMKGGDLLIIAGDLTKRDEANEYLDFSLWVDSLDYEMKILVGGNHDGKLQKWPGMFDNVPKLHHLCDSGTEFEGLKIWGSPWTSTFEGINPHCTAFTVENDEELEKKFRDIPHDVDILITHSPPHTILDNTIYEKQVGSKYLLGALIYCFRPKLWVFGHIHEAYGEKIFKDSTTCVNASHVNERYQPVNAPIRIILRN
jgi:Icc-related predicted phosphoesterase